LQMSAEDSADGVLRDAVPAMPAKDNGDSPFPVVRH
jgi:hypothetical protein